MCTAPHPRPRIGTQEKLFGAVMMDIVSLLAIDSELELALNLDPEPVNPLTCM